MQNKKKDQQILMKMLTVLIKWYDKKCINQVWKGDPRWWKESVETVCQNITWVLLYYIFRFVHKDPHALEFSSWGGGWKVFQFPCPCFYPHYMYVCSFWSHNTGHKPFYRSCFQLIDLLHMNRTLNINPHILSPLRGKKRPSMCSESGTILDCQKMGMSETGISPHRILIR